MAFVKAWERVGEKVNIFFLGKERSSTLHYDTNSYLGLVVEGDDVLHDLWVVPPVQGGLEVVPGQDVDLFLPRHVGEKDDLVGVAGLEEGLHGLELVARLGPLLGGQVVVALLVSHLGYLVEDCQPLTYATTGKIKIIVWDTGIYSAIISQ